MQKRLLIYRGHNVNHNTNVTVISISETELEALLGDAIEGTKPQQ